MKILFATAPPPPATAVSKKAGSGEKLDVDVAALAEKAAAGWGGDREVAYAADAEGPMTIVDLSTWDTEGDAKEAQLVAQRLLQKLADADVGKDDWLVTRDGDKLLMVFGAPKGTGPQVVADVMKNWKISR